MIDKVEAGKKYRLIDKAGFLSHGQNRCYNESLLKSDLFDSDLCIVIDEVDKGRWGKSSGNYVISTDEYRFFELVEENTEMETPKEITPETEVTITTTYGELAKVYYALGKLNGVSRGTDLWVLARRLLGDEYQTIYGAHRPEISEVDYHSVQEEWESLFFKSKEQLEKELAIKQKQATIAQLQKEIQELGGAV